MRSSIYTASLLVAALLLSACATKPVIPEQTKSTTPKPIAPEPVVPTAAAPKVVSKTVYTSKPYTPQLWSGHKVLSLSAEQCAVKGKAVLETMQFGSVVKNGNYVYGNYLQNRAAVKCVALDSGSFVYVVVAGQQKKIVEKLRNEIVWQF